MSRLLSVLVLTGMFAIMSVPSGAQAQSQAGGLPVVSDRVSVLEGTAAALQAALTSLQTTVTNLQTTVTTLRTQVTSLQTANTDLGNALNAEIVARLQGDSGVRASVESERLQRIAADSSLMETIGTLTSTGRFYETVVVNTFLVEGADAVLATLGPIPSGNYLVVANLSLENTVHAARWLCTLFSETVDQGHITLIDSHQTHTSLGGIGVLSEFNTLALVGIARLPDSAATVKVRCSTGVSGSDIRVVHVVAVRVGNPG